MRSNIISSALFLFYIALSYGVTPPNIIIVVIDDMGFGDMGYNNDEMLRAIPTMSDLSSAGIILDHFYVSPTCTPTRASLMTGRYTTTMGIQDSVIHATEPRGISLTEMFLPEKLKRVGYNTYMIGKWHLGFHQDAYVPNARGFDEFFGILTGGGGHTSHISSESVTIRGKYKTQDFKLEGYNLYENRDTYPDDEIDSVHTTTIYSAKALEYIDNFSADSPSFLYLAFQAVHSPIQVDSEYTDGSINNGCLKVQGYGDLTSTRQKLCGMISMVDDAIASIQALLVEKDLWDNTVMMFMSDNGGILNHGSLNTPLRGEKGFYFEGGIRVPAFLSGGYIENTLATNNISPYISSNLVHVSDYHMLALNFAGYDASSDGIALDGIDQTDSLLTGTTCPRTVILHNMNSDDFGNAGAIRFNSYKYLIEAKVSESEIYSYGQSILQDYDESISTITEIIREKLLKDKGTFYIFNLDLNPYEDESGECDDFEACNNLYGVAGYESVQNALEEKWEELKLTMIDSTLAWEDDSVLTDPALFGGYWSTWRDNDGVPLATYSML